MYLAHVNFTKTHERTRVHPPLLTVIMRAKSHRKKNTKKNHCCLLTLTGLESHYGEKILRI